MRERVLVDMDGVVVDIMGAAFERGLFDHYPCKWDFSGCCTYRSMDVIFGRYHDLFADAKPIDGAIDGVKVLIASGLDVRFVSTPWPTNSASAMHKYQWVERYGFDPRLLTLTHDKTLIPALALIDDKPDLVGPWFHVEYPQPWNSSVRPTWEDGLADFVIDCQDAFA